MSTDRERLAAALSTTTTCHGEEWPSEFHYRQIDALMPVVQAIAAEKAAAVLRAAAQEQRNEAEQVPDTDEGTHADGHRCAADFLDRRADALDPT